MTASEFDILAASCRTRLLGLARQFFGPDGEEESEDAVQETLMRLWMVHERIDSGRYGAELFAQRILKNYCVSQWRRRQRSPFIDKGENESMEVATENLASTAMEQSDNARRLQAAINSLSPCDRRVFIMCQTGEVTKEQVAETLGIKRHSVDTLLSRARRQIAEMLGLRIPYKK